jgi:signal transduction histidine kinase
MSLRLRFTLLLSAIIGSTILIAWLVAGHVVRPFAEEAFEIYLDEAVYVADRVDAGEDPRALSRKIALEVRAAKEPPFSPDREEFWSKHHCRQFERAEHQIYTCRTARAPVSVQTPGGWVTVRREIDFGAPPNRIGRLFILVAFGVLLVSLYMGRIMVRPLLATKDAMSRIAAGELGHRLQVGGPRELSEAAIAFNIMAERVSQMLEAERSLLAGISHELRTPLARLRLELELLSERGIPESRVKAMEADLEEIDQLIAELLEISRLELGERLIERRPVDLVKVVEQGIARAQVAGRPVKVEGASLPVEGDHERLVRVVTNLLVNAAKYAPGDGEITVILDGRAVEVQDRGPGVPEESLRRLFEPFYRVPGDGSRRAVGLGLGLMFSRQVIRLHGGEIEAKNREGGGLAVRFELPESDEPGRS